MRTERDGGEFLKATWLKWHRFVEELQAGKKTQIYLPHCQAAIIIGVSTKTLGQLTGGRFGIEILDSSALITFSADSNLVCKTYQEAANLLQLSIQGRAENYWQQLKENQPDLAERLGKVPGFNDLVDSIVSGGTPEQEQETVFQHIRLASWYASLPPGLQEGLIRPESIFTQPG